MSPGDYVLDDLAWHALTGPQAHLALASRDELVREPAVQYVATDLAVPPVTGDEVLELGAADSPDRVRLTAETEPGPFGPESHLTGRWFGVRREGRRVAMAGERMRVRCSTSARATTAPTACTAGSVSRSAARSRSRPAERRGPRPLVMDGGGRGAAGVACSTRASLAPPPSLPRRGLKHGRPSSRSSCCTRPTPADETKA